MCGSDYYMDIDIANCGPRLFVQVLQKEGVPVPPLLLDYAKDKTNLYKMIREFTPNATDEELKNQLLAAFHGGGSPKPGVAPTILDVFRAQVQRAAMNLRSKADYESIYQGCVEKK